MAFSAVTGDELSKRAISTKRGKAPIDLLKELKKHQAVILPKAVEANRHQSDRWVPDACQNKDWSADDVIEAWNQASNILHVKHPDHAQAVWLNPMRERMEKYLFSLKEWLWTHNIDYQHYAILIQMGEYPDHFMTQLKSGAQPPSPN
ncbi:MAG: hypothetical protein DI498_09365 [Paracoccus denitrificans]|nr:MAG: hypothetical protein DI498_09365 [Paracoccus denitrificans]PZO84081.1 MAG: hypothetical protein DI633_09365 [Paracoccus denitrificans]